MSKKIAILISGMAPGGAEASIATVLPEFIKNNTVKLYLLANLPTEIDLPDHPNFSVIRLNANGIFDIKTFLFLIHNVKKSDVILAHLLWAQIWTGIMGILSCEIRGKLIWFEHNCYIHRNKLEWLLLAILGKFTKSIVSVSQEVAEFLIRKTRLISVVIPNAIDSSLNLSCELPNFRDGLNVAFFGRLVTQKRPDLAVLEFSKYLNLKEVPATDKLVFIGDGYLHDELKKELLGNKNFVFKGYLSHSFAVSELCKCQIYINTSDYEGFCIARIEALSLGLCIVSRKNAGYLLVQSFFINDLEMREYGIFFVNDDEDIAKVLIELNSARYWTADKIKRRKDLAKFFKPSDIALKYLNT